MRVWVTFCQIGRPTFLGLARESQSWWGNRSVWKTSLKPFEPKTRASFSSSWHYWLPLCWKWGRPWLISSRGSFGAWKPRPRPSTGRPSPESQPSCYTSPLQQDWSQYLYSWKPSYTQDCLWLLFFLVSTPFLFSAGSHTSTLQCHRVSTSLGTFLGECMQVVFCWFNRNAITFCFYSKLQIHHPVAAIHSHPKQDNR